MSRHIQLEARLSLTGCSADERLRLAPSEVVSTLASLCRALEERPGPLADWQGDPRLAAIAERLAVELRGARGRGLVVCGVNDVTAQQLTAYANELLGGYGSTLSLARPSHQRLGADGDLAALQEELDAGRVDLLIVSGANPAYDLPGFAESVARAGTLVVHSDSLDETAAAADVVLPRAHPLEAWGDGQPERGRYSLSQPTVPPLRDGRSLRHVLSMLVGDERDDAALLRDTWRDEVYPGADAGLEFQTFFDRALHDGYWESPEPLADEPTFRSASIAAPQASEPPSGLELVLYPKVGLLDGRGAHNPWLQELPDPVSKVTWDNYACLSEARAAALGVGLGDVVRLAPTGGGPKIELPVLVQRGQHNDVVAVALGYGRAGTDRFAGIGPSWLEGEPTVRKGETIGVNAAPLVTLESGQLRYAGRGVTLERTGEQRSLACTQDHHSLEVPEHLAVPGAEVRDAVRSAGFEDYRSDPEHALAHGHGPGGELWPDDHRPIGHHWGMAVDLTSCTGCSACVIGCQAENNVPVVGKDEVHRHREMHWMRIDRYLSGEGDGVTATHQPMFCQQCDNAPCEWVCPVLATVHSSEGLNQQVYNRCVGTRYCANTCPYKVRRFNWFDYPREDQLANQALNPDVTVRTRGVMEKCTFCAQRIQEAKSEALRRGVALADGDIQTACQQSCPTRAIVFGDMADPESAVSKLMAQQRAYGVLEETNVKPSVRYLAHIRNAELEGERHDG